MKFTKMHGIGNDFVIINNIDGIIPEQNYSQMSNELCDRHFGIGADGLIFVLPSSKADYKMRVFNADGSEAEMCGNGLRCFARYVYENLPEQKDIFSVETLAGIMIPTVITNENEFVCVEVDMGEPKLKKSLIPMIGEESDSVINQKISVNDKDHYITAVSMGNPHAITYVENIKNINLAEIGPLIEGNLAFPEKTNAEFIQVINENEIIMRVWERGSGETLACGTGACASVVSGVLNQKNSRKTIVHLAGGDLEIEWQEEDNHVIMTGQALNVFTGIIDEKDYTTPIEV